MTTARPDITGGHLWEIHSGHLHRNPDGTAEITTEIRARQARRPPGSVLIGWAGWLLVVLAGGVLAVSFAGQLVYIYSARHQVVASNIEAGMFDVGMVIFAALGLGLAFAGKPARVERACVMVCSFSSAAMNYAAADVVSPRSVAVYVAPPLFLAVVVDRVIAVVRRHRLGDDEGSPWRPLGGAVLVVVRAAGLVLLYSLRLILDRKETARGLRQFVLNAAPLPATPAAARQTRGLPPVCPAPGLQGICGHDLPCPDHAAPVSTSVTKKAQLIALYKQDPRYGDRAQASQAARDLAPRAGLQAGTARTYINRYLASLDGPGS